MGLRAAACSHHPPAFTQRTFPVSLLVPMECPVDYKTKDREARRTTKAYRAKLAEDGSLNGSVLLVRQAILP
jgi:hypothetical protein